MTKTFLGTYIDNLEFKISPAIILLFLKKNQRYLKTKRLLSACYIRWKKNFLNCFKNEIKRAYTSIFTVSRLVIWLFLKNPEKYVSSVRTESFLKLFPKWRKNILKISLKLNQKSIYTSIITVSRVVIWLFLKNYKRYLSSVCA